MTILMALSCSTQRKLESIRRYSRTATLSLAEDAPLPEIPVYDGGRQRDTLKVQAPDGSEIFIMNAVRDDDGDMVAHDVITASYVTARFRNVAERNGKVDLRFLITVPASLQDSKWQLRFNPRMSIHDKTTDLDPVIITGKEYRKLQLRGYQQYQKFLQSIIADTTRFIRVHELEVFLERNLPRIYGLKTDSTFVSDEMFASVYGVTEKEAVEHYTNQFVVKANRRKIASKDRMYAKYVKVPIVSEGLKLDTVMVNGSGDFVYEYVQTINAGQGLRKAEIFLSGDIYEEDRRLYRIPESEAITFYISSLSTLLVDKEKYLTQVIERKASANSVCWIEFPAGDDRIVPSLGNNSNEIERIRNNLRGLLNNKDYELDSIIVTSSCSPEGAYDFNSGLAMRRSRSVSEYFSLFMDSFRDSLKREEGIMMNLDGSITASEEKMNEVSFIPRFIPENWDMFNAIVRDSEEMTEEQKELVYGIMETDDPDIRERKLQKLGFYTYLRESVYPMLRTVRFDFQLHRKGMIKDTVHTTVPDTVYMRGLEALKERDYETAVTLLRPYRDFNTAIAYCSMDYNASALEILTGLEKTAAVNYMLAILHSRMGDEPKAVEHYLKSCDQDQSFIHRGNLDPEISMLLKKYELQL